MPKTAVLERVEQRIFFLRDHKVMLSIDLAELYGVSAKVLVQAVKRNYVGRYHFRRCRVRAAR